MLQKIKIFAMVGICSIFTISNSIAQDKKVFDNVGVYFYPMIDVRLLDVNDYDLFNFDGFVVGLRTNIPIDNKFSFNLGAGYGKGSYESRNGFTTFFPNELRPYNLESNIIRTDYHLQFNIINFNDNNYLYLSGGLVVNKHFYEKYDFYKYNMDNYVFENKKFRIFNILLPFGFGYYYEINSLLKINIETSIGLPIWRNFNKIYLNDDDIIFNHFHSVHSYKTWSGIYFGLIYIFKSS
jgi:hypothetical protein